MMTTTNKRKPQIFHEGRPRLEGTTLQNMKPTKEQTAAHAAASKILGGIVPAQQFRKQRKTS